MTTQCGKNYLCLKDYKSDLNNNCSYTKGRVYHCPSSGYLLDDHNWSWSCSEEWFAEYLKETKREISYPRPKLKRT